MGTVKVAGDRSDQKATALVGKATQDVAVLCVYVCCSSWPGCRVGEGPCFLVSPHATLCPTPRGSHTPGHNQRGGRQVQWHQLWQSAAGKRQNMSLPRAGEGVCPGAQCGEQAMVKEQREVAGVLGGGERIFPDSQRGVPSGCRVSPNSGSVDHEAGTGRGSGRLVAESVQGKVKAKNIPKREGRGGALGCGLCPAPPLPAEVLRGPLLEMTEFPDCTAP